MTETAYQVLLTAGAEHDLESLYDYIAAFDSLVNAHAVLDQLMTVIGSLARNPERGSYPKELAALGIHEYRQLLCYHYRIIYRVIDAGQVIIYVIADGRRDMQSILMNRLFAP